jgi:MSHA biogenesis protein MshK
MAKYLRGCQRDIFSIGHRYISHHLPLVLLGIMSRNCASSAFLSTLLRQPPINKCFIIAGVLFCASPVFAETLSDPTRPPPEAASTTATGDAQSTVSVGPVLQSVTLSKRRKVATISGQEVTIGGKFGEATLIRMSDSDATLRHPDGTLETLRMYPRIEKKVILPKEAKPAKGIGGRTKLKE